MNVTTLPPAHVISEAQDLHSLAETLSRTPLIAVDTESNSLYAYQEQVCLIQFSTPHADYLVDPLALGKDTLQILAPIFADPAIEKVFHALEYDLIVLRRDFGFEFVNLFDTMWAATILGWKEVGLGAVLHTEFGVNIDKRFQKANWGQRPLPEHLLRYAALDTHYLIPLRNRQRTQIERAGLWELAREDFRRFCNASSDVRPENSHSQALENFVLQLSAAHRLTAKQSAVLGELYTYRDTLAREKNRAPFRVLSDTNILNIAQTCPLNLDDLNQVPKMPPRLIKQHGNSLLRAVRRAVKNPPPVYRSKEIKPNSVSDEQCIIRLNALREWRKKAAAAMGVKSDVVLPKSIMEQIARRNPATIEELRYIMHEVPWRLTRFGESILRALKAYY